MPLVFTPAAKGVHDGGALQWQIDRVKVGSTGAMTLSALAELSDNFSSVTAATIVDAYHDFHRILRQRFAEYCISFIRLWSHVLPEYALDASRAQELARHLEFYDVVDFDFLVDGKYASPKELYDHGSANALRSIAGLTRMSHVMAAYSEDRVRALRELDLGNRPDELWIVNVERLTRHHREHLTDLGKRLFFDDVVTGVEVILQQRATLDYVSEWVRKSREEFLDRLTDDVDLIYQHDTMRELLRQLAWSSDLYSDTVSVEYDSGSSFFRTAISEISKQKAISENRKQVEDSVNSLLRVSQAIFAERSAAASAQLQSVSVQVERSSRNMALVAALLALVATLTTIAQVWLAVKH